MEMIIKAAAVINMWPVVFFLREYTSRKKSRISHKEASLWWWELTRLVSQQWLVWSMCVYILSTSFLWGCTVCTFGIWCHHEGILGMGGPKYIFFTRYLWILMTGSDKCQINSHVLCCCAESVCVSLPMMQQVSVHIKPEGGTSAPDSSN